MEAGRARPSAASLGVLTGVARPSTAALGVSVGDRLSAGTIVTILIVGLLLVAAGLSAATWWYVRATRPPGRLDDPHLGRR